jgi:hypothetical protein
MKILKYIRAVWRSLVAFFRAYDNVTRTSEMAFPVIQGWEKLADKDLPYSRLYEGVPKAPTSSPVGAFIFVRGKERGETVYLHKGSGTLGSGATNTITVTAMVLTERKLKIEVSAHSVSVSSDAFDCPLFINGTKVTEAQLVDQDECSFGDSVFYFQELNV